ncbi:MAG: AtpZ/AtpI family protein [Flavobacteriales bacterium]|nr:AtpZ/AtpI family protein [Flavobacteriales bacterium]
MSKKQKQKKKQLNKYLQLTSIATQIGVTIFLGSYLGKYIDGLYSFSKPWFTLLLTLFAMVVSIYSVIQQLKKINKQDEE